MTRSTQAKPYLICTALFTLASACGANKAGTTPTLALSEAREGLPPEPRAMSTSPRRSGDTLICETSRKFRTSAGDRWLWVRILIDRKPGSDTEKTIGEALVSADPNGSDHDQKVELAGVALDG